MELAVFVETEGTSAGEALAILPFEGEEAVAGDRDGGRIDAKLRSHIRRHFDRQELVRIELGRRWNFSLFPLDVHAGAGW